MKYSGLVYYIILSFVFIFSSCSKDILDPNGFRGKDEIKDNYLVLRDQTIFLSPSEKTEIKSVKKDENGVEIRERCFRHQPPLIDQFLKIEN